MEIVGSNIRRFRKERNYSLREFAEKVGASASFISQVEMGKVKPSLSKLKEIADGLNTTVGLLIGESVRKDHSRIVRKGERKHTDHLGSGINVHLLSNVDPFKQMQPLLMELDRGASSGDNQYQHYLRTKNGHQDNYSKKRLRNELSNENCASRRRRCGKNSIERTLSR